MKFYTVAIGRKPGIYLTWEECKKEVDGFSKPKYKSFKTQQEAEEYYKKFNNGNLPKDKSYANPEYQQIKHNDTKYKYVVNCVLCGRPFKQQKGKNGTRHDVAVCRVCKNNQKSIRSRLMEITNGEIKYLSQDELLYIKKKYNCDDVLTFAINNPNILKDAKTHGKTTHVQKELHSKNIQNTFIQHDSPPTYIKQLLGESKEFIRISGDKRNPLITFHCKRCEMDFTVKYKTLRKGPAHDCSAIISSGEAIIKKYLSSLDLKYLTQRKTLKCVNPDTGYVMPYDFEIPDKKIIIEVQGEQHRTFIERFHIDMEGFKYQQQKDAYKKEFAEEQGYQVIEIWYSDFENENYKKIISKALSLSLE